MPESERANVKHAKDCCAQALTTCKCGALQRHLAPTLTCSEVVERLAGNAVCGPGWLDRAEATKILAEWRERRVQELEERIAKHSLTPELSSTQLDTGSEKK